MQSVAASDHGENADSPGTRRLSRDERQAQIIETAGDAFLVAGFDGTSMEDVAQRAGVSRLLIYRIFENKQRLYRAVLSSVTDEFVAEFEDLDLADVRRRGGIVRVMLGIARRHSDAFRLLWRQAAQEPAFAEFARTFRRVLNQHAEALIALDGGISNPRMLRWCATTLAAHLLDGMCQWLDEGDPSLDDDYVLLQVCGLFAMIKAWREPQPPHWVNSFAVGEAVIGDASS